MSRAASHPAAPRLGLRVASRPRRVPLLSLLSLYRERRALARLDGPALRDVGLDPAAARAEAARPIWDVPAHWHSR